jgi:hypothetical protein
VFAIKEHQSQFRIDKKIFVRCTILFDGGLGGGGLGESTVVQPQEDIGERE